VRRLIIAPRLPLHLRIEDLARRRHRRIKPIGGNIAGIGRIT